MAYVPQNTEIFQAAFNGAIAGAFAAGRIPVDTNPANPAQVKLTNACFAFAQSYDALRGPGPSTCCEESLLAQASQGVWSSRVGTSETPSDYDALSAAIKTGIDAANAKFAGEGITCICADVLAGDVTGPSNNNIVEKLSGVAGVVQMHNGATRIQAENDSAALNATFAAGSVASPGGTGGNVSLEAGNATGLGGTGGAATIFAGESDTGGAVTIVAGEGTVNGGGNVALAGGEGATNGGNVTVAGGAGGTGSGGTTTIAAGAGDSGGFATLAAGLGATVGGNATVVAGDTTVGSGGNATVAAGNGTTAGGGTTIAAGAATAGLGGIVTVAGGAGTTLAGAVNIIGGAGGPGASAGDVNLNGGIGSGLGSFGGNITAVAGPAGTIGGSITMVCGGGGIGAGSFTVIGGDGGATGSPGACTISAGNTAAPGQFGGAAQLNGGDSAAHIGGDVFLIAGNGPVQPGKINLQCSNLNADILCKISLNVQSAFAFSPGTWMDVPAANGGTATIDPLRSIVYLFPNASPIAAFTLRFPNSADVKDGQIITIIGTNNGVTALTLNSASGATVKGAAGLSVTPQTPVGTWQYRQDMNTWWKIY